MLIYLFGCSNVFLRRNNWGVGGGGGGDGGEGEGIINYGSVE